MTPPTPITPGPDRLPPGYRRPLPNSNHVRLRSHDDHTPRHGRHDATSSRRNAPARVPAPRPLSAPLPVRAPVPGPSDQTTRLRAVTAALGGRTAIPEPPAVMQWEPAAEDRRRSEFLSDDAPWLSWLFDRAIVALGIVALIGLAAGVVGWSLYAGLAWWVTR